MRILHLADGDPWQPEVGGSAVRTREVVSRLSAGHDITVLVAAYPDARERVADGVLWVPIGPRLDPKPARLAFLALAGREIRRRPHDLIVEDFGAPFSVGVAPAFTRKPVVAVVHWLFARELRQRYHLPFDWVERAGLAYYRHFIAVSGWLGEALRARRSGADIEVIPNGIDAVAFAVTPSRPEHLLFVGRLDVRNKGLDFLLEIMARLERTLGEDTPRLLVIGAGADRDKITRDVKERRLEHLIHFLGHVAGHEKYELMARSFAVLMPSRYESFGMVALEAQAAAVPLVAFDIGPIREVTGGAGVALIRPFDLDGFTAAVLALVRLPRRRDEFAALGREWARHQASWSEIARRQGLFYLRVASAQDLRQAP